MTGYRTKLQMHDAAEIERKARLARMAEQDEMMRRYHDEARSGARMLSFAVILALLMLAGVLVIAADDLVAWVVGGPVITIKVPQ